MRPATIRSRTWCTSRAAIKSPTSGSAANAFSSTKGSSLSIRTSLPRSRIPGRTGWRDPDDGRAFASSANHTFPPPVESDMLNVDPAELAKFSALAHRWWDPASDFKPLHDINPLRLRYIEERCGGLDGKRVLDVGCGGGILSEAMARAGAKVTGIDLSEKALSVARLHQLESGIAVDYRLTAAETL